MTRADQSAIRDRVRLIVHERGLSADEIQAAMQDDDTLMDFGIRHGLSFDWLLLGDLRGWRNFPRS